MRRVLLDVDGVSADFVGATLDSLLRLGGPVMTAEDIVTWDIFGSVPRSYEDALTAEWHKPGWCAGIPLYEGARDAVLELREVAEVVFVTTAMNDAPHWLWEREQWLRRNLNAGGRDLVFTAAKHLIVGDVFVDDKASNVAEWHRHHPHGTAVLWDQPYNRQETLPGVLRLGSWAELLEVVTG